MLEPFLPSPRVKEENGVYSLYNPDQTMGQVRGFYGNFLVVVRALTYLITLGKEGIPEASAGRSPQRQLPDEEAHGPL